MYEEGGYYAIKGFAYQYIVSLIEILSCNDENKNFVFENLQDFNNDEIIYQMKYKETQRFTNGKVKEPTIKIFDEYLKTKKDYILYVYFSGENDHTLCFKSSNELDKILLNCIIDKKTYRFTEKQKNEFIKHFKIIFSRDYISKCNELIQLISKIMNVSINIAEVYSYSLVSYVINVIINNTSDKRVCTKRILLEYIKNSSSDIFYAFSLKYYNKEKYLKIIRNEYFFEKNINDHNRVFVFNVPFTSIDDFYDLICCVVNKFYVINKRKTMIISSAPYIFLSNIDSENLLKLKKKMFGNIDFTDGYLYKDSDCNIDFITKKFMLKDSVSCKLINNINDFQNIIKVLSEKNFKLYEFYNNNKLLKDKKIYSIKVNDINDIIKILK